MTDRPHADPYRRAIRAALAEAVIPVVADELPTRAAVERGAAWPVLSGRTGPGLPGVDPATAAAAAALIDPLLADGIDPAPVAARDRAGHARAAYKGLLGYALFRAVRASGAELTDGRAAAAARWVRALAAAADAVVDRLPPGRTPAAAGGDVAGACWAALGVSSGAELLGGGDGRGAGPDAARAATVFAAVVARQQPGGAYLAAGPADNPETLWYHELQTAHAVASYGLQAGDASAVASARRAAAWHQAETQPDHATNQPWGLTAFLLDPDTGPAADGQLHAAAVQHPGRLDPVSLILLADALYSLRS